MSVNASMQKCMNHFKKNIRYVEKSCSILGVLALGALYLFIVDNYAAARICLVRNSFLVVTALYAGASVLLCAGGHIRKYWEKVPQRKYLQIPLFLVVPILAFYICEVIYNPLWQDIAIGRVLLNYILLLLFEIGLLFVFRKKRTVYSIMLVVAWVYGIANYYVLEFKGNPLLPSDLISYKTAMGVVGNYTFYLADAIVSGTLLLLWGLAVVRILAGESVQISWKKYLYRGFAGVLGVMICTVILLSVNWAKVFGITVSSWAPDTTYFVNGGTLAFLLEIQSMSASKPDGYSRKEAQNTLEEYTEDSNGESNTNDEITPSVIVIMNESFSDLKAIGDFESGEYLENWNSMTDYIMKGNLYTSVYGGGTCNSEFEFLTGHSMVNFSGIVYPYQMYNLSGASNMASIFAELGYKTIAIHPAAANNWNREKIYQQLGFQDFISLEDMQDVQYIRNYASDAYDYELVKQAFEESEEPVFIFNVTIQNHGGYEGSIPEEVLEPVAMGSQYKQYADVRNFLTLMKESDRAFAELLEYFSNVEEPVIVCLFGDHQPAISTDFIEEIRDKDAGSIEGKASLYCTPYVIWSNYEMDEKGIVRDMSLNYLGANVLEAACVHTPYSAYLLELQQKLPIINTMGNRGSDGQWQLNSWLDEEIITYQRLQYYMLFDEK